MHPVQFAAVATNATRLLGARGQGSASLGSRHETGNPAVRARAKLPAANHRSTGPRRALPPGPRRAGREVATAPGLFSPPGKLSGHPSARRKHRGAGVPSARASRPARPPRELSHARVGRARGRSGRSVARLDGLRWQARRAAAVDHGRGTHDLGWLDLARSVAPPFVLLQCAQDGDPFFSVHVLYCLDR